MQSWKKTDLLTQAGQAEGFCCCFQSCVKRVEDRQHQTGDAGGSKRCTMPAAIKDSLSSINMTPAAQLERVCAGLQRACGKRGAAAFR